ncbi:MAG: MFS transporter [Acidimicrobiia bacterium]|nr:MFS transporter [Acidimicrobiia bacterium]
MDPAAERRPRVDEPDPADIINESLRALRDERRDKPGLKLRLFGSPAFYRLWLAQVITSFGDWLGFLAIVFLADRIGAGSGGASVGFVMAARIAPGFFFAAGAGVLIDRMDRKQVMVVTTLARAVVVASLPFVDTIIGLVFASLVLEVCTLFFSPAKEASVPNLVPADHLTTANSLSIAAAYGTFPLAAMVFALLAKVAVWLGSFTPLEVLRVSQESVAFYVEVVCFVVAALMLLRLPISREHLARRDPDETVDLGSVFREIKEGWQFIFLNPVVRSVNVGLATGLIGGGMLVPLGPVFSRTVLDAGAAGFSSFITALGLGVCIGVIFVSVLQRRIPKDKVFSGALVIAGVVLIVAVSLSELLLAAFFIMLMGICAGTVYVLGFTLLHENVHDELRGRTFSGLYTLVRMCVLLAFAVGPLLSGALDGLSASLIDKRLAFGGVELAVPGVRLTLWLAGAIMIAAGIFATLSLRAHRLVTPVPAAEG